MALGVRPTAAPQLGAPDWGLVTHHSVSPSEASLKGTPQALLILGVWSHPATLVPGA